jgi:hypothetical protein
MVLCHKWHISFDSFCKGITKSWLRTYQRYLTSSLSWVLGSINAFWWQFRNSCNGSAFQLFSASSSKISSRVRSVAHHQNSTILKNVVEIILSFGSCTREVIIVVAYLRLVVIDSYILMSPILASILSCVNGILFKFSDSTKSLLS